MSSVVLRTKKKSVGLVQEEEETSGTLRKFDDPEIERLFLLVSAQWPPEKATILKNELEGLIIDQVRKGKLDEVLRYRHPQLGYTLLHASADFSQKHALILLLRHGADPNSRLARCGETPLHIAALRAHLEIVALLREAGADPCIFDDRAKKAYEKVPDTLCKHNGLVFTMRNSLKSVPPSVEKIHVLQILSHGVRLTWEPPVISDGVAPILGYQVKWKQEAERPQAKNYLHALSLLDSKYRIETTIKAPQINGSKMKHLRRNDRIQSFSTWQLSTRRPHHMTHKGQDSRQLLVTGLYPGCEYTLAVSANNAAGFGLYRAIPTIETIGSIPEAPGAPVVIRITRSSILLLSWIPPRYENGAPITKYELEAYDEAQQFLSCFHVTPTTILPQLPVPAGLYKQENTLQFKVRAKNTFGWSDWSKLSPPFNHREISIRGLEISTSSMIIEWDTNCVQADYWELQFSKGEVENDDDWIQLDNAIPHTPPKIRYFVGCDNLRPGKYYRFRVRCKDPLNGWHDFSHALDTPAIRTLDAVPDPPNAPLGHGERSTIFHVFITWNPNACNGPPISKYQVQYVESVTDGSLNWDADSTFIADAPAAHVRVLSATEKVRLVSVVFRVRAFNAIGWSGWSMPSAPVYTNPILPPGSPSVGRTGMTWIELNWTPPPERPEDVIRYVVQLRPSQPPYFSGKPTHIISSPPLVLNRKTKSSSVHSLAPPQECTVLHDNEDTRELEEENKDDDTGWTTLRTQDDMIRRTQVIVPDLKPTVTYYFRVQAHTLTGYSTFSETSGPFLCERKY